MTQRRAPAFAKEWSEVGARNSLEKMSNSVGMVCSSRTGPVAMGDGDVSPPSASESVAPDDDDVTGERMTLLCRFREEDTSCFMFQ